MAIDVNKFLKSTSASKVNLSKFGIKPKTPQELQQEQINQIMAETKRQTELELNSRGFYTDSKLQLLNDIKSAINPLIRPFTAEGRAETTANNYGQAKIYQGLADTASKELGRKIEAKDWVSEVEKLTKEERDLVFTKRNEKITENTASVVTAPVRFTAGSLATAVTSYALEKANYDGKFTPKTDTEKMIIGGGDIQRLLKQEDLYGTIARGAGVPAALITAAVLENPFMTSTGISKMVRKSLEDKIVNKTISKFGSNEFLKMVDDAIETGVKEEKISKDAAVKLTKELTNLRLTQPEEVKLLEAPKPKVAGETIPGEGFTMKTVSGPEDIKLSKLNTSYDRAFDRYNRFPTKENLDSVLKKREQLAKQKELISSLSKVDTPELKGVQEVKLETPGTTVSKTNEPVIKSPNVNIDSGLNSKSLVPMQSQRITVEAIESSLTKDIEGLPSVPTMTFKEQAALVKQIIDEDPEKPIRIALGKESPTNGAAPESVFRVVKEQAQKNNDIDLLKQLATDPKSVGVKSKELGQRIKMLDSGVGESDALTNISKVIKERKSYIKRKSGSYTKTKSSEVKKIKKALDDEIPSKGEWEDFINSITC